MCHQAQLAAKARSMAPDKAGRKERAIEKAYVGGDRVMRKYTEREDAKTELVTISSSAFAHGRFFEQNKSAEAVARFDASIFLLSAGPPKLAGLREWRRSHVHVANTDFVSRGSLCGEPSPVSTPPAFAFSWRFHAGAIRFLFWWLFLHRRLRSRQRGPRVRSFRRTSFRLGGVALIWLIISNECSSFLSEQLRSFLSSRS